MKEHYQKLVEQQTRLNRLNHLKEIAFWDQGYIIDKLRTFIPKFKEKFKDKYKNTKD